MNVLSLFDGMSCCQLALKKLGVKVDKYYASEIDPYAIKVTMANFPDTIHLGDVTRVSGKDLPEITLLAGGSPCQGFSFAGKGLNFDDPRSKLFFEFVRLKNELKPKYFLLENVRMKKEHEVVISKYLGVEPIVINSALVSAQNRVRLYWCNINAKEYNLFGDIMPDIPQPADKGILLRDILQKPEEVGEKYYISETALKRILRKEYSDPKVDPEKSGTINTKNNSGQLSVDSGTTLITDNAIGRGVEIKSADKAPPLRSHDGCAHDNKVVVIDVEGKEKPNQDKAGCLTGGGHSGGNHSDMDLIIQRERGNNKGGEHTDKSPTLTSNSWQHNHHVKSVRQVGCNPDNPKSRVAGLPTEQMFEEREDDKSGTITTVQKDNLVREKQGYIQWGDEKNDSQAHRAYLEDGKCATLRTGNAMSHPKVIIQLNESKESGGVQPYQQNRIYDDSGITPSLLAEMSSGTHAILQKNDFNPLLLRFIRHIFAEIFNYEKSAFNKRDTIKVLFLLWKDIRAKTNEEWQTRVNFTFQQKKILRQKLYEDWVFWSDKKRAGELEFNAQESENDAGKKGVCELWVKTEFGYSSQGRELEEQWHRKFTGLVSKLSQKNTSSSQKMSGVRESSEFSWLLRETLPAIQKIWNPIWLQGKPIFGNGSIDRIRRLTEIECARLQNVPDEYFYQEGKLIVSSTQVYKMLGNGWNIDTIVHILSFMSPC